VNFRLAPAEMLFIINDASPTVFFFEMEYAPLVDQLRSQLKSVERYVCIGNGSTPAWAINYATLVQDAAEGTPPFRSAPDDIAYIIYTSGTTGRPKGCVLGQRESRMTAQKLALAHGNAPDDRTLLMMPFFHIGAKAMQNAQHQLGGTVYIQRGFNADAVLRCVAAAKITTTHMAPIMVQMLLEAPNLGSYDITSLRTIVYGAAPMPIPVLRRGLQLLGSVFIQTYGQTESLGTALARHDHRPDGDDKERARLQSVGRPYMDVLLRILDDDGNDCSRGAAGEIALRSNAQFRGYWNNSAATLETLQDGWVRTGDIGRIDEQGLVYLVDRKKDMIISGGENIYSREVEDAILQHAAVLECAVIGIPDAKWGESVCAVIVLREGLAANENQIIEHCKSLIASYKKPRRVMFVDNIQKLPSGKVSKVELRRLYSRAM
jgi:acyl-CoA synthetase (AMP-forming)/AMP-acid ligase II